MSRIALLKLLDRLLGPPLARLAALSALSGGAESPGGAGGRAPRPSQGSAPPAPILLIRPGGLGDAAVLLPSLAALRAALPPAVRFDILCEPRNEAVFGLVPLPNTRTILYTRRPLTLRRRLRRAGYAAVLDTEQSHWFSAIFAAWSRAPVRIGFDTMPARSRLYTESVPYDPRGPEREQFHRLLSAFVPLREGTAAAGGCGGQRPPSFAVLHIGGSNPSKHWAPERWAALCDALHTRRGLRAVLVGSAADRATAARVASLCHSAAPENRAGALSLAETAALCADAALFIGPDSGIAHLADLAGTPSVVLFGSGDAAKWGPCHGTAITAAPPLPCAPCSRYGTLHRRPGCRYECMAAITPEAVLEAAAASYRISKTR